MNTGSLVERSDQYPWCICTGPTCWCLKKGRLFEIVSLRKTSNCQGGSLVSVRHGKKVMENLSIAYFVESKRDATLF